MQACSFSGVRGELCNKRLQSGLFIPSPTMILEVEIEIHMEESLICIQIDIKKVTN